MLQVFGILLGEVTKGVDIPPGLVTALLLSPSKHTAGASEHQR